jgi:hypothetical protein
MPHREWNPKSFFRQISPNSLVALLRSPGFAFDLDGEGVLHEQAYRAWKAAPEALRHHAEGDLLPLNDLSAPHARPYLEDLAASVWAGRPSLRVMGSWSVQDLAVRLYLADTERFAEAHRRYALDLGEPSLEFRGRYPVAPKATAARKAKLLRALSQCLRASSRGARSVVEDFSDDTKLVLRVFHEGELHVRDQITEKGTVEPVWTRPVHLLSLVFYFDTSVLLIRASRGAAEKLSALFAELYAEDASYFENVSDHPRFCFDVLRDPQFPFPTKAADQVEAVSLVRVVARHTHHLVRRVVVDLEPSLSLEAAHRALAENGIDMSAAMVDGVRLHVRFQGMGRRRIRTVHLANPNTSNLHDTERDRLIRGYLQEWGIDAAFRHTVASSALEATKR